MSCPPLRCSHQILLPDNCCPTCINLLPNDCIQGNASNTSPNTSCIHLNQMYQNGESWPLVETSSGHGGKTYSSNETGCASCKCKVLYSHPSCCRPLLDDPVASSFCIDPYSYFPYFMDYCK